MAKGAWLKARFDYKDTCRAACRICGQEMDVRAGRAFKHWTTVHGIDMPPPGTGGATSAVTTAQGNGEAPVPEATPAVAPPSPPTPTPQRKPRTPKVEAPLVVGSREWAVKEIQTIAADPAATPEQKLKALDLLKEYQDFGTKRLDDEKESEESRLQWERVFSEVEDLRAHETALLKDPSVQKRLLAILPRGL